MNQKNVYLASKPRYAILDGLRGVAALVVILFHGFETYIPFFGTQHINHGYLAVDFFFVLSGFVIGYAYDDRWDRMSTWSFFKRRLIRLHPMVVAGTLFGACLFFFGESDYFSLIGGTEPWKFFLCIVLGLATKRIFSTAIPIRTASMRQERTSTRRTSTSWRSFLKNVRT